MNTELINRIRYVLHLVAYPGPFMGRPSEEQLRELAKEALIKLEAEMEK